MAAIAPSGQALARLITREVRPSQGPVLELGAGTGVFTRALLGQGVREADLTLIEAGVAFAQDLRQRFPQARVLCMDASRLARSDLYADTKLGAVVSGLPLLSMPRRRVMEILSGAFAYLGPAGSFYQFTYFPGCPVPRPLLDRLGLKAVRIGGTFRNLPPAAVYRISRRRPFGAARASQIRSPASHRRAASGQEFL
ncbi:class I SAM-dependent methyltransferase [Lysobacter sp. CA199]|uniref:class I SAM-dependent methyltransferase n=1 Tax=Lysobacter sp. CA199 TaxID=3455608 RepID=UPI003F8D356B